MLSRQHMSWKGTGWIRLEILLAYSRIEALRERGKQLGSAGTMCNVDELLRQTMSITLGTKIRKEWPGNGMYDGEVTEVFEDLQSTIHADGREVKGFHVRA